MINKPNMSVLTIAAAKRILLVSTSANGMTNRMRLTLEDKGHIVHSVSAYNIDLHFNSFRPDLVIAPFLKTRIPKSIYTQVPRFPAGLFTRVLWMI